MYYFLYAVRREERLICSPYFYYCLLHYKASFLQTKHFFFPFKEIRSRRSNQSVKYKRAEKEKYNLGFTCRKLVRSQMHQQQTFRRELVAASPGCFQRTRGGENNFTKWIFQFRFTRHIFKLM